MLDLSSSCVPAVRLALATDPLLAGPLSTEPKASPVIFALTVWN